MEAGKAWHEVETAHDFVKLFLSRLSRQNSGRFASQMTAAGFKEAFQLLKKNTKYSTQTFNTAYALHSVSNLHVVALEGHEDPVGVVRCSLCVYFGVAMREFKPVITIVLSNFPINLKVFLYPAERQEDLVAFPPPFHGVLVIDQTVNLLVLRPRGFVAVEASGDRRSLLLLLGRCLLALLPGRVALGGGSSAFGAWQAAGERAGSVGGASVPEQHRHQGEEGADDDQSLVVDPSCQATHIHTIPAKNSEGRGV